MTYFVTITSQGQVSIPAPIRRKFGLDKINKARVETEADKIIIIPAKDILDLEGVFKTKKKIPYKLVRAAFGEYLAKRST